MSPWKRGECYVGTDWTGWLVGPVSRNRDSSLLETHNFDVVFQTLKPQAVDVGDECGVQIVSENHCAVGWIEWIAIHPSNTQAIQTAELLAAKLENYPILSEMEFSNKEYDAYLEAWNSYACRDFVRELERKELIAESALDDVPVGRILEFFESAIPSGDYHTDGAPNVRYAVDSIERGGGKWEIVGLE